MSDINLEQRVQVILTVPATETVSVFVDALYYPIDEVPTESEMLQDAQERYDNWKDIVSTQETEEVE